MYESLVILAETILSSYPILIKKVDTSLSAQTGVRMTSFAVLAAIIGTLTGSPLLNTSLTNFLSSGLLNLMHVGASYTAFEALPAGNAMSLFYTYPVWNLLGAAAVMKESIPTESIPWMGVALLGAILLSQPTAHSWTFIGVVAALLAAITETGIYLWFRSHSSKEESQPWTNMFQMYGGSAVLWAILVVLGIISIGHVSGSSLSTMILFNTFVGFTGYALRFFTIPHVSTVAFSSISFVGIVAAYLLGWIFVGEVPNLLQGMGAVLVILANAFLLRKEFA
jgi:drug/metabolite transporter (DMT)-like permease